MTASIADTSTADIYFMSSTARNKLARESYRSELRLRKLVAHANLVDSLYDELEHRRTRFKVQFAEPPMPVRSAQPVRSPIDDIPEYSDDESDEEESETDEDETDEEDEEYSPFAVDNNVKIVEVEISAPSPITDSTFATEKVQNTTDAIFNQTFVAVH